MEKISQDTRIEYWKNYLTAISLGRAKDAANQLFNKGKEVTNIQSTAEGDQNILHLLTSLYVHYARPFKQWKNLRLDEAIVPENYSDIHLKLIKIRDKMIAHFDYKVTDEIENPNLNRVVIRIRNGELTAGIASYLEDGFEFERIERLCNEIIKKCNYRNKRILEKSGTHKSQTDGFYEVDLGEGERYLLKTLDLSTEYFES
jgi:hypothetical protein